MVIDEHEIILGHEGGGANTWWMHGIEGCLAQNFDFLLFTKKIKKRKRMYSLIFHHMGGEKKKNPISALATELSGWLTSPSRQPGFLHAGQRCTGQGAWPRGGRNGHGGGSGVATGGGRGGRAGWETRGGGLDPPPITAPACSKKIHYFIGLNSLILRSDLI